VATHIISGMLKSWLQGRPGDWILFRGT